MSDDMDIDSQLSNVIRTDIDAAYTHIESHVTAQGDILKLDRDCEYCIVYFVEGEF